MTTKDSAESMIKMASSHTKIAAVMIRKQQFAKRIKSRLLTCGNSILTINPQTMNQNEEGGGQD